MTLISGIYVHVSHFQLEAQESMHTKSDGAEPSAFSWEDERGGGRSFPSRMNRGTREEGKKHESPRKKRVRKNEGGTRVFSAEEEQHTHDIPQPRNAHILPTSVNLTLLVHSSQRLALIRHFVSADPAYPVVGVGEALFKRHGFRHAPA